MNEDPVSCTQPKRVYRCKNGHENEFVGLSFHQKNKPDTTICWDCWRNWMLANGWETVEVKSEK